MKLKNIIPVALCILIGFFMGTFMLKQYNREVDAVSLSGENLYFIQVGVFSSEEAMKKELSNFTYYIYTKENNMYHAYTGITKDKENLEKLKDFYVSAGYDIYVREMFVSNISFITVLSQYDLLLNETTDTKIIESIENQVLSKYEELIMVDKD